MLSLIDLITLRDLWCAFKPRRPLHRFPQEQLMYSTFEIDLLLIISGWTILLLLIIIIIMIIIIIIIIIITIIYIYIFLREKFYEKPVNFDRVRNCQDICYDLY